MSIDAVLRMLRPPLEPRELPTAPDWESAERQLGKLPDDYKGFVAKFGTGQIDDFLWVYTPSASSEHLNLVRQAPIQLKILEDMKNRLEPDSLQQYPDRLLPFGRSDNGDALYWVTEGKPADWTVLVHDPRAPRWETFELNMTDFISSVLKRKITCTIFPDDFPTDNPRFSSH
jgi:hypothetical protein